MQFIRLFLQIPLILIVKVFLYLFTDFTVEGKEKLKDIDSTSGVIFALNHKSQLDTILFPVTLKLIFLPMYFIALKGKYYEELYAKIFYGGYLFKLIGGIIIDKGLKNYEATLKEAVNFLEKGRKVAIFIEGRRIYDKKVFGIARGGAAYLSYRTGLPVVPVTIVGTHNMSFKKFFSRTRKIRVIFGEPKKAEDYLEEGEASGDRRYKLAASRILEQIENTYIKHADINSN